MSENDKDKGEALITVSEMADRLQCGNDWVYEKVNDGTLPCIKINARFWRFHWPTVLEALKRRR